MPRFSAAQIYAYAIDAGFTPDQATTMTAIAMAESGGLCCKSLFTSLRDFSSTVC